MVGRFAGQVSSAVAATLFGASASVFAAIGDGSTGSSNATVTTSFSSSQTVTTVPVIQTIETYSTRILGSLSGNPTALVDFTFSAPYSDPSVQAALTTAQGVLSGASSDPLTISGPTLVADARTLVGSTSSTSDATNSTLVVTLENSIGPGTIIIGDRDNGGTPFEVLAGTTNLNVNTHTAIDIIRTITTANTFLTSQVYQLIGTPVTGGGVAADKCPSRRRCCLSRSSDGLCGGFVRRCPASLPSQHPTCAS